MRPRIRQIVVPKNCKFCLKKTSPNYKVPKELEEYTTDRGKILARSRTGMCAKHQRRLAKAIKRARFLALLPFSQTIK